MPDATEWLVEYRTDGEPAYDHFADREKAIESLRQLVGQGRIAMLYQLVPFTAKVDVTLHGPRRRRKKEAKEGAADLARGETAPPSCVQPDGTAEHTAGSGSSDLASPVTRIGAATPRAAEVNGADTSGAPAPLPTTAGTSNPAGPYSCEARFDGDPLCPGHVERDPVTGGWFCDLHLTAIAASCRREMHRRHASRNRPVRVAHAG